jgi:hypothetical protein
VRLKAAVPEMALKGPGNSAQGSRPGRGSTYSRSQARHAIQESSNSGSPSGRAGGLPTCELGNMINETLEEMERDNPHQLSQSRLKYELLQINGIFLPA